MDKDSKQLLSYIIVTRQLMPSITDLSAQTMVDILDQAPAELYDSSHKEMLDLITRIKG